MPKTQETTTKQTTGRPDYPALAEKVKTALATLVIARSELKDLPMPVPDDESEVERIASEEFESLEDGGLSLDTIRLNVRARLASAGKIEKANSEKRDAHDSAQSNLEAAVLNFYATLQADLTNSFADGALDRIDRYAGRPEEMATLMIDMAPALATAKQREESPRREQVSPRRGFSPARDY